MRSLKYHFFILFVFVIAFSITGCGPLTSQSAAANAAESNLITTQPGISETAAPPVTPTGSTIEISTATATAVSTPEASSSNEAPDTKNITVIVDGKPVTMVNGLSEVAAAPGSSTKVVTRYFGNEATGDLNGDGKPDVVFLITQEPGGSAMFFYIVADYSTDQGYQVSHAVLLGDRIAPQNTLIQDGKIVVNYADRKPDDPMTTAPSEGVSKYFKLLEGQLVEDKAS